MQGTSVFKTPEGKNAILAVYDSLLKRWPVPYETIICPTRHGDIHVVACGDKNKPPLVLLHGAAFNSAMWLGDAAEYVKHFRVYAVDLPGEAGKSTEYRPDLLTSAYAEWVADTLDALHVEKACFVGMSLGGWTTLKFATAHPERTDRIVLLCPAGIGRQKVSFLFRAMPNMLLGKRGEENNVRLVMGTKNVLREAMEYSMLINRNHMPYMGTVPLLTDDELKKMTGPVLVIVGEKDVMIHSKETIARVKRILPHAQAVLLPGAGHGLIDQKERILGFLLNGTV